MASLPAVIAGLFVAVVLISLVRTRYQRGLRSIPGPFSASIFPVDRILSTYHGHQFQHHLNLHAKYGPIVRIGPTHVSVANSDTISQIYGHTSKFGKSNFYTLFHAKSPMGPIPTVFSIVDPIGHRDLKRPVGAAYALSSLLDFEPMTDECTKILERKLDTYAGQVVDFGTWLHWYAWDVITSITFSNRLGFLEKEEDVNGIIAAIEGRLFYNSIIGQVPALHKWLLGNPYVSRLADKIPSIRRLNSAAYIVQFAARQLQMRQDMKVEHGGSDMLDKFKRRRDGEEVMSDKELLGHASSNVLVASHTHEQMGVLIGRSFAGSDTTAISLRAFFYYLCKNPRAYKLCVAEILDFDSNGELSEYITYHEAQRLPYFQACMREALRMHPAVGQLLERVVPEGGAIVEGLEVPAGTIVGMNPWIAARDRTVYGNDAYSYRPERWLDVDEAGMKAMDRNWLAVSAVVAFSDRAISLTSDSVRSWSPYVSGEEYLIDGNVKAHSTIATEVRCPAS
jgi:cytochrome P450